MEKLDDLINILADHIKECITSGNELENEIAEKTKALAELVSARASQFYSALLLFNSTNLL